MTQPIDDNLEQELAALTQWEGKSTTLWRQALRGARASKPSGEPFWHRIFSRKLSNAAMIAIACGCVFGAAVIILPIVEPMRNARKARSPAQFAPDYSKSVQPDFDDATLRVQGTERSPKYDAQFQGDIDIHGAAGDFWTLLRVNDVTPKQFTAPSTTDTADRQVTRTVTIELKTNDIRAAFLKAQHLIHPADSEFIQESSLSGSGNQTQANLTLRVRADRLSDVLNELRELGKVESERHGGQDVTSQVVDLGARLKNETRVEAEILELLESRKEAPLKDILDMREKLSEVRNEIERLTGRRQYINKLVALATVLVIIRADDAPEPEAASLGEYFGESLASAWKGSLHFLVDTLATMLRIIVGGLFFWVILVVIIWAIRRYRRAAA